MKGIGSAFYAKPLSIYLIVALVALSTFAVPAEAMFLPAASRAQVQRIPDRTADLARIQRLLESKTLQQRLVDYGLSPQQAMEKLKVLPDENLHQLAGRIDALQAGGRAIRFEELLIILLLVLLIVIIAENKSDEVHAS